MALACALGLVLLEGQSGGTTITDSFSTAVSTTATLPTTTTYATDTFALSGEVFMFLAAQSMAAGTLMVRWVSKHCDPVAATGLHLLIGGLPLAALAATDPSTDLSTMAAHISPTDALLLLYVALFGSAAS